MEQSVLEGVLRVLGITVTMAAAFAAVVHWSRLADFGRAVGRRLHLVRQPAPLPAGRPIEEIAADVGRLRVLLRHIPPETPEAKREGWRRAYDDVLAEGCWPSAWRTCWSRRQRARSGTPSGCAWSTCSARPGWARSTTSPEAEMPNGPGPRSGAERMNQLITW